MMYDVVVIGGGMIGASAALACQRQGLKVALLESKPMMKPDAEKDLRAIAVSYQNAAWLNTLGVKASFHDDRICAFDHMYLDDESGEAAMNLSASDVSRSYLGLIIDSHHIQATLQAKLCHSVDCFFEEHVVNRTRDALGHQVTTNKRTIKTQAIIAADGSQSWMKDHLQITHHEHDYQQRAIVAYIQSEKSHDHTAWQRFLSTGTLALLPCADLHTVSMVWTLPQVEAHDKLQQPLDEFIQQVQARMGQRLGRLQMISDRASFPIRAKHAHAYGAEGIFLVGDAAHTVHPLAGLGANLGFADVRVLVQILRETPMNCWGDARVLARYQRERQYANALVSQLMTVLNQSMAQTGILGRLRGWGMRAVHQLTPLKALSILYTDHI